MIQVSKELESVLASLDDFGLRLACFIIDKRDLVKDYGKDVYTLSSTQLGSCLGIKSFRRSQIVAALLKSGNLISYDFDGVSKGFSILSAYEIIPFGRSYDISITLSKYFVDLLDCTLTAGYTKLSLDLLFDLKSIYSRKLFIWLSRLSYFLEIEIPLTEVRYKLGCTDKYSTFKVLNARILKPALEDLASHGIHCKYEIKYDRGVASALIISDFTCSQTVASIRSTGSNLSGDAELVRQATDLPDTQCRSIADIIYSTQRPDSGTAYYDIAKSCYLEAKARDAKDAYAYMCKLLRAKDYSGSIRF